MSELKWNWAYYPYLDPPEKQAESALKAGYIKVVNKDEADKVIADLKDKGDKIIFDLKDKLQKESALLKETRDCLIESQKMHKRCADNAARIIRCSDRKRCLAMAKACHEKSERMYCEASTAKSLNEILGKVPKDAVVEKFELRGAIASTHRKIWLSLAEEPTWEKFLQLIHKEAK